MSPPRFKPQPPWKGVPNIQIQIVEYTEASIPWLEQSSIRSDLCPPGLCQGIQLNFRDLRGFEPVHNQYQQWGVRFEGAIALQPSNPAFAAFDTPSVMPMAPRSRMAIHFQQPQQFIGSLLTGAQPIRFKVYDAQGQLLVQQQIGSLPYLHRTTPTMPIFPKHQLHCYAQNMSRIELSSDSPFLLHQFFCC